MDRMELEQLESSDRVVIGLALENLYGDICASGQIWFRAERSDQV